MRKLDRTPNTITRRLRRAGAAAAITLVSALTAAAPVGAEPVPAAWREIPGVRASSGNLTVRPKSAAQLRAAGLPEIDVRARTTRARSRLAPNVRRHHAEVDEYVVRVPAGTSDHAYGAALLATGDYDYVVPDWIVHATAVDPNDPLLSLQWHHDTIDSRGAWAVTTGAPQVVIAVCDSGVDTDHPDLQPLLVPGYNAPAELAEVDGGSVEGLTDHGTEVAGAALAIGNNGVGVAGVGWDLRLMPIRVSNSGQDTAAISDINDGARWAVDNGARIINASFSGPLGTSVATTGEYIRERGGVYVWSAGNGSGELLGSDPPAVLIVGATDQQDRLADFSNYGIAVDVVAPGVDIHTTVRDGYAAADGTSYAAPIVAGVLGLMWTVDPALTPERAELLLKVTAFDLGLPGEDGFFGAGRIDAAAAVTLAAAAANTALPPTAIADDGEALTDAPVRIDVLANDYDVNGDAIMLDDVEPISPAGGVVAISRGTGPDGRDELLYTRPARFEGLDSVTYTLADAGGLTASGTVTIVVDDAPTFDPPVNVALDLVAGGQGPHGTAPADVDGDGDVDVVVVIADLLFPHENEGVVLLRNDGGALTREPAMLETGAESRAVAAADLDGDGRDDVVVANSFSGTVSVLMATPAGLAAPVDHAVGDNPRSIIARDHAGAPLDLDDDGKVDVVTADVGNNTVSLLFGTGDGGFEPAVIRTTASGNVAGLFPNGVTAADLTGNGRLDVATVNALADVAILENLGARTFAAPVHVGLPLSGQGLDVADVNDDGALDLVVAMGSPGDDSIVGVAFGEGPLSFGPFMQYPAGVNTFSVEIADLDGDGDADVVAANRSSASLSFFLNRGDGILFGSSLIQPLGLSPIEVDVADLDGDGRPDLVAPQFAIDVVSTMRNVTSPSPAADLDGDGSVGFTDLVMLLGNWGPCDGCAPDLDGDGTVGFNDLVILLGSFGRAA